jgi:hypothetical protein
MILKLNQQTISEYGQDKAEKSISGPRVALSARLVVDIRPPS